MDENHLIIISVILIILGLISLAFFSEIKNDELDIPFKLIDDTYRDKSLELVGKVIEVNDYNTTKIITLEFNDKINLNIFSMKEGIDIKLNDKLIVQGKIEKYEDKFYIRPNLILRDKNND
jgi:hypothetical protein